MTRTTCALIGTSLFAAATLLLSACGSSSSKSGTSTSAVANGSSSGSATAATGTTWTVGAIDSLTGVGSSGSVTAKGALQAWADYTNAHGGINGHPIKVITMDDQSTASVALAAAHTLIEGNHVIALVGSETNFSGAWGDYVKQQGVPIIGGGVSTAQFLQGSTDFYATSPGTSPNNNIEMQVANELGATNVGSMYCAEVAGCQVTTALDTTAANNVGVHFVKGVAVSATAPSYTAPCLALKDAGAQAVVMNVGGNIIQSISEQCSQQSFNPVIIAIGSDITAAWTTSPAFAKAGAVVGTFPWFDTTNPAIATFNQAMKQYDKDPTDTVGETDAEVWEAGMIFQAAAKAAKLGDKPTAADVITGLNSLSNETLGGLFAPISYTNGNRNQNCGYAVIVKNGKLQTLFDGKPQQC